ncbi:MAG: hypothetical protein AAF585_07815 [Verrucomicrobiota bacterium]
MNDQLQSALAETPADFQEAVARLINHHLDSLAARIDHFIANGAPNELQEPFVFEERTLPLLQEAWRPFEEWKAGQRSLADAIQASGVSGLLLILGQRLTPASLTDERGIPASRQQLLDSASKRFNEADELSVAGRALTKHEGRSDDPFWPKPTGSPTDKNETALQLLESILDNPTWWNVFEHFSHAVVYEARLPSGHGARWGHDGGEFIGFLEMHDETKRF